MIQGIGAAIAKRAAQEGANLILFARSEDKLAALSHEIQATVGQNAIQVFCTVVDVREYDQLDTAIKNVVKKSGPIDVVVNNAGLALGAPARFPDLEMKDIIQMVQTNIQGLLATILNLTVWLTLTGYMNTVYAVLNAGGMMERKAGTILNVTSTTGLEVPPFPGEAVYHSSKAAQEAFSNVLRTELQGTNIKVLALRPGVVATNFHEQRVGYDKQQYDDFMDGFEPLAADEVAESAIFMLSSSDKVAIQALSVVPTAQRSLQVFDRTWNERNQK